MLIAAPSIRCPAKPNARRGCSSLIDGFASRRVLVVGDLIADEFIYGEVARVSREAPVLILKYDATRGRAGRRRQRRQQRRGARRPRRARRHRRRRCRRAGGCWRAFRAASIAGASCARGSTGRRSRRASSPAACTRRSSRWCASIARPAGRSPSDVSRAFARSADAGARRLRRRAAVRLRIRPRHAGARRRDSARRWRRARGAAGAGAARQPLPAARLPRPDDVHAERVGSRAGARHPHRRRRRRARAGRADAAAADRHAGGAHHARQPRHGAVPAEAADRFTFRSSGPTKSPTSPAPATPSSRRSAWRWPPARRSTRPRGSPTTPAASW